MAYSAIYIPTFISSVTYQPARVLPHIYFYNGTRETDTWYLEGFNTNSTSSVRVHPSTIFPYFDNYSGNTPTTSSLSLLFNNEAAVYGEAPTASLYQTYWETYVSLLYNPKTRLLNCSAIIPLADYFKMELNDIVNFRGNYYHLRAINDYNLSTGECNLQLLGPIIKGTLDGSIVPPGPTTTTTTTTAAPTTTTTLAPTTTTTSTTSTTTTAAPTTTTTSTTTTLAPTTTTTTSTTTTAAPTTTTTTSTTTTSTTTTTAAPTTTTTTTTYITKYLVELCGGGIGPYIVTLGSGDTPSGIGQAFKISGNSGAGFNGTNCWEVLEIDPIGNVDYANLAFGSVFSNCTDCNNTNTTTTTSTTSTTTTTAAPTTTTTTSTTTTTTTAAPTTTTTTTAAPTVYAWDATVVDNTSHSSSCTLPYTTTYYTTTNVPILNTTIIYLDSALTTTLNGGDGFVKMKRTGITNEYSVRVNSSGLVTRVTVCPVTTTTTSTTSTTTTTTTTTAAPTTTTTTTTVAPTTTTTAAPTIYYVSADDVYEGAFDVNCLGVDYYGGLVVYRLVATLKDGSGNTITNSTGTPIYTNVNFETNPCFGGTSTGSVQITIPTGGQTGSYTYYSQNVVDCGTSVCAYEYETALCVTSLSGSGLTLQIASGSDYTYC